MKNDIEIAKECKMLHISKIAEKIGLNENMIDMYGKYKCKILLEECEELDKKKNGELILVTAMSPTPYGEGKSTITIGLGQALCKIGKNAIITIREPSLGPVFGMKGGAAGGGYSQIVPMEDINLHFTGDMHAITSANNLLSATIDNHINYGNMLGINPNKILFKRVVDMNDRALRNIIVGLGGTKNGYTRQESYTITVASEIMAILCVAKDLEDLKKRFGEIIIAYDYDGKPLYCKALNVNGAMALLMKDAINPNLVQTVENTPAIVHGGPFANIAHGCNSLIATKMALKLGDYVVTEAGFGADLGAEKFLNIKSRLGNLNPKVAVIVATIRALKYNGNVKKEKLSEENVDKIEAGFCNLKRHYENICKFGVIPVIAINRFHTDTDKEIEELLQLCKKNGYVAHVCESFAKGSEGGIDLAKEVCNILDMNKNKNTFHTIYDEKSSIKDKIETIAKEIYRAESVEFSELAQTQIRELESNGLYDKPICMAKTQYSFSDKRELLGAPEGFKINITSLSVSNGAGFIVVLTGDVMTMPGLPRVPAAERMNIDNKKNIVGLF